MTRHTDTSKDYLGEGFAFLAKSCLSRFRCWIVIPWPSSGFDSAAAVDFTAVGAVIDADFAVDCVLDWRTGTGKLFVTLIDCRDGSEVWSHLFPVAEHELQEISSSVAGAVAANLASQVNHITLLRHARSTPGNPVAYDLWLKGHQLSRLWSAEADAEAEAMFLKAIELDPGLAGSHASLAQVLSTRSMVRPGYANRKADCAKAFKHAREAIALDPYDPRCHISMAWNWAIARSPERANSHFRLAVDMNPHDAETLIVAASGLGFLGHAAEARNLALQAVRLNPIYPEYYTAYLAGIHFMACDHAPDAPLFLAIALPRNEGVTGLKPRLPAGRGLTTQQAMLTAGAEAMELRASLAQRHLDGLATLQRREGLAITQATDLTSRSSGFPARRGSMLLRWGRARSSPGWRSLATARLAWT